MSPDLSSRQFNGNLVSKINFQTKVVSVMVVNFWERLERLPPIIMLSISLQVIVTLPRPKTIKYLLTTYCMLYASLTSDFQARPINVIYNAENLSQYSCVLNVMQLVTTSSLINYLKDFYG